MGLKVYGIAALLASVLAVGGVGYSRSQTQRLEQRVAALERDLEAAKQRLAALEGRVQALEQRLNNPLGGLGGGTGLGAVQDLGPLVQTLLGLLGSGGGLSGLGGFDLGSLGALGGLLSGLGAGDLGILSPTAPTTSPPSGKVTPPHVEPPLQEDGTLPPMPELPPPPQ
ncbi:MAG TPA: hypothetical protein EYP85_11990 [Armatimonadetes bacterium]|nr:hypothetical protein [Armatimonadota bacterium]